MYFFAEGQRSPHIIIYDFEEFSELSPFQRIKAKAKFWRWICPFSFQWLDHSIWDDEHYVPIEFSIHWKHGTPFNLLFEWTPEESPQRKKIEIRPKKKFTSLPKTKKRNSIYYKKCVKCGFDSYLATGNFYFCTNKNCLFKEGKNAITPS